MVRVRIAKTAPIAHREAVRRRYGEPELVDPKDAEDSALVACAFWENRIFLDAMRATCADCGRAICHRPHVPKIPPKVCYPCADKRIKAREEN